MKMKETKFKQKRALIIKYAIIWFMSATIIIIRACRTMGEKLPMLLVDMRLRFCDNPILLQSFKNKLLVLSMAFLLLIIVTLFTEDFRLKLRLGKWETEIKPGSKILRWGSSLCLALVTIYFVWMGVAFVEPWQRQDDRETWGSDLLIAHAGGGIDGVTYTNSVEAFKNSYQEGVRTIEIDLRLTSDDKLVCIHDWEDWAAAINSDYEDDYEYSEAEFMSEAVFDRFTPMSMETLFELMREYGDVWIVTDTKATDWVTVQKEFQIMVDTAQKTDSMDLLDRFVVQLYNYNMYDAVEEVYSFPSYILTLYALGEPKGDRFTEHCRFCRSRGIDTITMWDYWVTPERISTADDYGINIYVHTVNDPDDVRALRDMGVDGFYTDYIFPQNFEEE